MKTTDIMGSQGNVEAHFNQPREQREYDPQTEQRDTAKPYRVAGSQDCEHCGGEDEYHFPDCPRWTPDHVKNLLEQDHIFCARIAKAHNATLQRDTATRPQAPIDDHASALVRIVELTAHAERLAQALREIVALPASATRYDGTKGAAKLQEMAMAALAQWEGAQK